MADKQNEMCSLSLTAEECGVVRGLVIREWLVLGRLHEAPRPTIPGYDEIRREVLGGLIITANLLTKLHTGPVPEEGE